MVSIQGHLEQDKWEQDGKKHGGIRIAAVRVRILGKAEYAGPEPEAQPDLSPSENPERRKPDRRANSVGIRIKLTLSAKETRAVGRDLACIKAGRDRKIIHPVTCRFPGRVFKEAKTVNLNAYMQGKHMFSTLYETGFGW
jgi:single-stranded DNA-binding protein